MKHQLKVVLWLLFAAIFFIPFLWYSGDHLIIGGDLTFPLKPAAYFGEIFQIWRRVYTSGNSAISLTTLPFYAPMALFDVLGFSLQTVQKFHFGLWLALPAISMFYLAGVIFRSHPQRLVAQLIAVAIYLFNTYEVVWADSARMAVWVGLPLMLGFFINGLSAGNKWLPWAGAIALTSVTTSTAAANPPMFIMFAAIFIFWLLFHFATRPEDRNRARIIQVLLFMGTTFVLALLVNLFWIVPYANVLLNEYKNALTSGLAGINFQNWLDPISTFTSLLNVMRLQGAWDWYAGWQGEPYVPAAYPYQHNQFYLAWSVLVPFLAFTALLIKDKSIDRKVVLFFAMLSLLGLLFSAGSHEPSGKIYKWLVEHLQFFSIYRSPWYKFSTWTVLGYSILIAASVATIVNWLSRKGSKSTAPAITGTIVALFIAANLIYSSGLVLGKVFPKKEERIRLHSAHVDFPDYFFKAADWINSQPGDWRILQLPAQQAFNYNWGLGTLMDMTIFTFNKPTIWWPEQTGSGGAKGGAESLAKAAFDELYLSRYTTVSRLLGLLNIKYMLQKDDIDYSFYATKDSPEYIKQRISRQKGELRHTEGPWQFYEIPATDQRPLLYPTSQIVNTSPANDGFLHAVYSSIYSTSTTYTDHGLIAEPLVSELANAKRLSYYAIPDLKKAEVKGNKLILPLTVPAAGSYQLSFDADESATELIVDKTIITTSVANDRLVSQPITLTAGEHTVALTLRADSRNLIPNPSFEEGLWEQPVDSSKNRAGSAAMSGSIESDATDGKQSARITSAGHSAAIRRGISEFEVNRLYLISFDYKHRYGEAPSFTLWQEESLAAEPTGKLPISKEWATHSVILKPRPMTAGAILFLYADGGEKGIPTEVLYDNVRIVKLPKIIDSLVLTTESKATDQPLPTISYNRLNAGHYTVSVTNATKPFILNFLESFDIGWQAKIDGKLIDNAKHFRASTYANGWLIDATGNYTIDLYFRPQKIFQVAALASFIGLILCLLAVN